MDRADYKFPYAVDETQEVAKAFAAVCTPDFFLFDERQTLVYRGRLDDAWRAPASVQKRELADAIRPFSTVAPRPARRTRRWGARSNGARKFGAIALTVRHGQDRRSHHSDARDAAGRVPLRVPRGQSARDVTLENRVPFTSSSSRTSCPTTKFTENSGRRGVGEGA